MPHFSDAQDLNVQLGRLLRTVIAHEHVSDQLRGVDGVVRYRLREPEGQITIRAYAGQELKVELGESTVRPDVLLQMTADTLHALWTGEANITLALANGEVVTRGATDKVLKLIPVTKSVGALYRAQLEAGDEVVSEDASAAVAEEAPAAEVEEAPAAEAEETPAAEADEAPAADEAAPAESADEPR